MKRILIVEDDINLGTTLSGALEMQGYKVLYLTNGERTIEELSGFYPDIVILDIMLNGQLDGFEIAKLIRNESNVPVLFTTSRDGNEDFIAGFSIENTDYVRKPYKLMEVMLRIDILFAKQIKKEIHVPSYPIGNFYFFPGEQLLKFENEKKIHLNNYEAAVLELFCENLGVFVLRSKIIEQVWHESDPKLKEGSLNNVLSNLRKYMKQDDRIILESKIKLGARLIIVCNK